MDAAGIGAGAADRGLSSVGAISISGGKFTVAIGLRAAAIGAGYASRGDSAVGAVDLVGGDFELSVGLFGAAIGGGYSTRGNATVGNLTIANATFRKVQGGVGASAIGGGHTDTGDASVGRALIRNAVIDATGGSGASVIGQGSTLSGNAGLGSLEIVDGSLVLRGQGAIGPVANLTLLGEGGQLTLVCDVSRATCITAPSLLLKKGTLLATTNSVTIVDASTDVDIYDGFDVTGEYLRDSQTEPFGDLTRIHFTALPSCNARCEILLSADSGYRTTVTYGKDADGALKSVPPGVYAISVDGTQLKPDGGEKWTVGVGNNDIALIASNDNLAAIIGGIVGGVVSGVLIAIGLVFLLKCKREPELESERRSVESTLLEDEKRTAS
jgi:hypothetical protein